MSLDAAIPATVEYQHYLRRDLIWQWGAKVTAEEALLACKLIMEALRNDRPVNWQMEARTFLNEARAQLGNQVTSEAAGPNESVAHDEGPVCALEDQPEDGVVEGEPVVEERKPDADHDMGTHDPGFPDLNELLDEARELAADLEGQGEREDSFARELLRLIDENKMIMEDHGLEPMAQEAIIRAVRGDSAILTTSVDRLAAVLQSVDPRGGWVGGLHPDTLPDVGNSMLNMARRLSKGGSWIAQVRIPITSGPGHFVLVEG